MAQHFIDVSGWWAVMVVVMPHRQGTVAAQIDVVNMDIGLATATIVMIGQSLAQPQAGPKGAELGRSA